MFLRFPPSTFHFVYLFLCFLAEISLNKNDTQKANVQAIGLECFIFPLKQSATIRDDTRGFNRILKGW